VTRAPKSLALTLVTPYSLSADGRVPKCRVNSPHGSTAEDGQLSPCCRAGLGGDPHSIPQSCWKAEGGHETPALRRRRRKTASTAKRQCLWLRCAQSRRQPRRAGHAARR